MSKNEIEVAKKEENKKLTFSAFITADGMKNKINQNQVQYIKI